MPQEVVEVYPQILRVPVTDRSTSACVVVKPLGHREMSRRTLKALKRRPRVVSAPVRIPRALVRLAASLRGLRSLDPAVIVWRNQDLAFDLTPASEALGDAPRLFQLLSDDPGCRAR